MTRGIPAVCVALVLLGGCSPAEAPETATSPETAAIVDMELESLRQRAEQGDADAQYNLGFVYQTGLGVPQDFVEAVRWYRLAADQGFAEAQANLGRAYYTGQGVPQDYVEAHKWANLATARVTEQLQYAGSREVVAALMSPAQLAEAQQLAREWQAAFDARQE